jgi:hypothetical protein
MLCGSWETATVDAKGAEMNTSKALVLAGIKGVFIEGRAIHDPDVELKIPSALRARRCRSSLKA